MFKQTTDNGGDNPNTKQILFKQKQNFVIKIKVLPEIWSFGPNFWDIHNNSQTSQNLTSFTLFDPENSPYLEFQDTPHINSYWQTLRMNLNAWTRSTSNAWTISIDLKQTGKILIPV